MGAFHWFYTWRATSVIRGHLMDRRKQVFCSRKTPGKWDEAPRKRAEVFGYLDTPSHTVQQPPTLGSGHVEWVQPSGWLREQYSVRYRDENHTLPEGSVDRKKVLIARLTSFIRGVAHPSRSSRSSLRSHAELRFEDSMWASESCRLLSGLLFYSFGNSAFLCGLLVQA